MLGKNVVVKCPYCGKVLNANLGITNYYNYENRTVFVEYHCDRPFITEDIPEDQSWVRIRVPVYKRYLWGLVYEVFDKFYSKDLDEDTIYNNIVNKAKQSSEFDEHDLGDLKAICQYVLERQQRYETLFSLPLTDEVQAKMTPTRVVCW